MPNQTSDRCSKRTKNSTQPMLTPPSSFTFEAGAYGNPTVSILELQSALFAFDSWDEPKPSRPMPRTDDFTRRVL